MITSLHLTLAVAVLALSATPAAAVSAVSMAVTPAGDVTLRVGTRTLATGTWRLRVDSYLPTDGPDPFVPGGASAVRGSQSSPTHATTHEDHANGVAADYTYDLAGEDLTVTAHVTNGDPRRPLKPVAFAGLTFHLDPAKHVAGHMGCWYWTYLQASGRMLFHPSTANPLGVWWAGDDDVAFSVQAPSEFDRTKFVAATWQGQDNVVPAECEPNLFTDRPVPPGGSVDVRTAFRISAADRSIAHLIANYRADYDRRFPLPTYAADARLVGQFAAVDRSLVTAKNPLGYNGEWRRLDSPLATAAYVRRVVPQLLRDNAVGMIFWAPGGVTPVMYNPEFDDIPKPVQANLAVVMKAFHGRGLRVGLCARPGEGVQRQNGTPVGTYRLSADDPEQMKVLLGRFRHATDMGFDMFYLDTFGGDGTNDLRILAAIRQSVGPDVLLYTEYSTDLSLAYAGRYCEWVRGGGVRWNGPESLTALHLLAPHATWLCASETGQPIPKEFAPLDLTPIVGDQDLGRIGPWVPPVGR